MQKNAKIVPLRINQTYDLTYAEKIKKVRFAVDTREYELLDGSLSTQSFIVVKENTFGFTLRYTGLEQYAKSLNQPSGISATSPNEKRLYAVCDFLNFVMIDNYDKYGIKNLEYLTVESIEDYCNQCAGKTNRYGRYNSKKTTKLNIGYVIGFLHTLQKRKYLKNIQDDVITKSMIISIEGRETIKTVNNIDYCTMDQKPEPRIMDMPDSVLNALFLVTSIHDPMMLFCFAAQAFAGLREGEVLNLRGEDSCFGSGLFFTEKMNEITDVEIDLTKEYQLRTDKPGKENIKRIRKQRVYPLFLNDFVELYHNHLRLLETYNRADTKPLFINQRPDKNGVYQAMTYKAYKERFDKLILKLQTYLRDEGDMEMKMYADLLLTHKVTPHVFRHYFSVQVLLSLKGTDTLQQLMYWRGDRSPQSSMVYLADKGRFRSMYKRVTQIQGTFLAKEVFRVIEGD